MSQDGGRSFDEFFTATYGRLVGHATITIYRRSSRERPRTVPGGKAPWCFLLDVSSVICHVRDGS